ncbi:hypothetical protein QTI66_31860 [Variovorax sp. J22R133]|uniref:hypothetical protein n=1 Tax=Variovorax brevis TaxID=3053503 RepID=UPI002578E6CC|nr:hypothetical protein [Variovorax sp. J22R133]MDM0116734.1 hypothetical protein [Variovorax sp. J22R133]
MARVAAAIPFRPYAVCPPTNLMNPDGFFVVNMGPQYMEASLSNTSGALLANVRVYVEGISDPGITYTPNVVSLGNLLAGASTTVRFLADFHAASPGAAMVSLIVEADGATFRRILKKIFITRIDYQKPTKTFSVVMPQGTMKVIIHSAIVGAHGERCHKRDRGPFIALLKDVTYDWIPNPPYEGTRGPFPYEDPWCKIALAILAALLLAGALLWDYFSDGELDGGFVSVSGTFEETDPSVACCTDISTSATDTDDWIERGLYAAVGIVAAAAIASDGPDLHYRGQDATPPKLGEVTLSERVRLKVDYIAPPSLGRNFPIEGKWEYVRTTDGGTYTFGASDHRQNIHWLDGYEVEAPVVHDRIRGALVVRARFQKPDSTVFRGINLYVSAVLVNTHGDAHRFTLIDDGRTLDKDPNDGWYTGGYQFKRKSMHDQNGTADAPGTWYLFVFAQDVNTVAQGTDPFTAAHTIGGFVLTNQLDLQFNAPCQLRHDAVIQIV